ncbi:hypothetical protein BN2475_130023 [Paraburkholderia ribeironis]|uniref:Uncharacterized protein n=1 Tax=Paraburkholderia ribeironis TaxID=1247936 RepID=A0A1N7RS57_9BURK|nr:hypothetical protein BN2475_130023 [Paraburkholderia ribeironis]
MGERVRTAANALQARGLLALHFAFSATQASKHDHCDKKDGLLESIQRDSTLKAKVDPERTSDRAPPRTPIGDIS